MRNSKNTIPKCINLKEGERERERESEHNGPNGPKWTEWTEVN